MGKDSAAVFSVNRNSKENPNEKCLLQVLESQPEPKPKNEICLLQDTLQNVAGNISNNCIPVAIDEIENSQSFIEPEYHDSGDEIPEQYGNLLAQYETFDFRENIHRESLKYIAGYIAFRFKNKYNLGISTGDMEITNNMSE